MKGSRDWPDLGLLDNLVKDEPGQARYPDDAAPVVAVDDGQVLTADLLGRDFLVCPLGDS